MMPRQPGQSTRTEKRPIASRLKIPSLLLFIVCCISYCLLGTAQLFDRMEEGATSPRSSSNISPSESSEDPVDVLMRQDRFDEARSVLDSRLAKDPDSRDDLIRLGRIEVALGNTRDAVHALSRVFRTAPGDEEAKSWIELALRRENAGVANPASRFVQRSGKSFRRDQTLPAAHLRDSAGVPPMSNLGLDELSAQFLNDASPDSRTRLRDRDARKN